MLPRKLSTLTSSGGPTATGASGSNGRSSSSKTGAIVGGQSRFPVVVFSCWLDLKLGDYRRGWWGRRARHHRDYHILPRSARPPE